MNEQIVMSDSPEAAPVPHNDPISRIEAALKDEPTPGPWMHLFGDRIIYTVLEDGCRGRPVASVDHVDWEGSHFNLNLNYIAACNPVAIRALLDRLKAAEAEAQRLRESLRGLLAVTSSKAPGTGLIVGAEDRHAAAIKQARATLENTDAR